MRMYLAGAIGTALLAVTFKLYGPVWLVLAAFCGSLAVGCFGIWVGWGLGEDHAAQEAADQEEERYPGRHRHGDPAVTAIEMPRAGRLPLAAMADPAELPAEQAWRFTGESEPGWAAESAEYELLTRPDPPAEFGTMDTMRLLDGIQPPAEPMPPADILAVRRKTDATVVQIRGDISRALDMLGSES